MEKDQGIILKKLPLSDTSLIIVWATETHGVVRTAAKGARRPGSAFAGRLDLFYQAELGFVPARSGSLHALREVVVTNHRSGITKSYNRILAASYFVRLLELVTEEETPIPEKVGLLGRALDWLDGHEPNLKAVGHFERQIAGMLGLWAPGQEKSAVTVLQEILRVMPEQRQMLLDRLVGSD